MHTVENFILQLIVNRLDFMRNLNATIKNNNFIAYVWDLIPINRVITKNMRKKKMRRQQAVMSACREKMIIRRKGTEEQKKKKEEKLNGQKKKKT